MFSSVSGINFYRYDELLEAKYVARKLMFYGVPSTGDLTSDKQILKRIEAGERTLPVASAGNTNTEQYTGGAEYSSNLEQAKLETERTCAEQLGILMKLRLGLI